MAKSLELTFFTDLGKQSRITVDNPKEPVDPAAVKLAMEEMIAANIIMNTNGEFVAIKNARVVERNVTEYEIV